MTLGDCIREFREDHDMSQRQFADYTNTVPREWLVPAVNSSVNKRY